MSVLDWKSSANPRVCRSTFAAETTACSEAIEMGQYVRSFVETVLTGQLCRVESLSGKKLKCISDCKSLFDHLHREGVPRVPSDKRLAIDLAALRQAFSRESPWKRYPCTGCLQTSSWLTFLRSPSVQRHGGMLSTG